MENKQLSIVADGEFVTLTYFEGENSERNVQMREKCSAFHYPDDFMYACAYLIDELAKDLPILYPENKPYAAKTVCVASPDPEIFKVGKIYEWKDGRTVNEKGCLLPTKAKLFSPDEITNPLLKFIEIVE